MKAYEEAEISSRADSEITLGMRSILGIFLGLVLICGVFFGFGYSLGRGNADKEPSAAEAALHPRKAARVSAENVKTVVERAPTADSTLPDRVIRHDDRADSNSAPAASKPSQPKPLAASPFPASARTSPMNETQVVESSNAVDKTASPRAAPLPPTAGSTPVGTSAIMVQIAAVSHQADADVLVSALGRLGYSASVHIESTDNLLHVQIGPFATRDEAKAMRTKLLNDGYNAILK